jgi:protein-L-isoaspartate(D-aspartate) O-methyltransferase
VNAGVTHPQRSWLEALAPGGRMVVPLTASMPAMGANLGKGVMVLLTRDASGELAARMVSMVAIYSGVGLRDDVLNARLGEAMSRSAFPRLKRLRLDQHEPSAGCWLHGDGFCFSLT